MQLVVRTGSHSNFVYKYALKLCYANLTQCLTNRSINFLVKKFSSTLYSILYHYLYLNVRAIWVDDRISTLNYDLFVRP